MNLQLPSFKRYIIGAIYSLIAWAILYILFGVINVAELTTAISILVGLLIGHFIGAVVTEGHVQPSQHKAAQQQGTQTLYIGNLAFKTSRNELRDLFAAYGKVHSARIMVDKATRKPRGYGFVEMNSSDADKAIAELNGSLFAGRNIKVSQANERNAR